MIPILGSTSIRVFEANNRALDLALGSPSRKPVDLRYNFLPEFVGKGGLSAKYFRTEDQQADILTMAIGKENF